MRSHNVPGPVNIQETNEGDFYDDIDHDCERTNEPEEEKRREKSRSVSMRRLAYLNKPEVPILLLGSLAASIHGVIFPLFGYLISSAIKIFYEPAHLLRHDSTKWALVYVSLGVASLIAIPFQNFLFAIAGGKLIRRIRLMTFEKVVHQEVKWFDHPTNSSGAIGARLSTDAANVRSLVGDQLALIMQNIATVIAGLVIAFTANWILALIILAVAPLMFAQGYLQGKFMKGFSADAKIMYEEASQVANDAVGSIRTVASFCAENKVMDLYKKKCEAPVKSGVRLGLISGLGFGFSFLALYCTNAFCFYIGAILIHHGKATFAEVFQVFFALTISAVGLSQSNSMAMDRNKAKDSAVSIFKIVDSKPSIDSSSNEGITQEDVTN
ncbi:hypothetical protein BVRB_6g147770 [Beta vulgaris subsp. vulgaris]|nr:hypothetical protein BVRB_6g147770 [Beta vulgaris subsp. vulgaris]